VASFMPRPLPGVELPVPAGSVRRGEETDLAPMGTRTPTPVPSSSAASLLNRIHYKEGIASRLKVCTYITEVSFREAQLRALLTSTLEKVVTGRVFLLERDPVPIGWEAGWAPKLVWMLWRPSSRFGTVRAHGEVCLRKVHGTEKLSFSQRSVLTAENCFMSGLRTRTRQDTVKRLHLMLCLHDAIQKICCTVKL
jgi:hypothetical protein